MPDKYFSRIIQYPLVISGFNIGKPSILAMDTQQHSTKKRPSHETKPLKLSIMILSTLIKQTTAIIKYPFNCLLTEGTEGVFPTSLISFPQY